MSDIRTISQAPHAMTRTVDDVIADVRVRASGRTRFEGQAVFEDEVLVAEIEALRDVVRDVLVAIIPIGIGRAPIDPDRLRISGWRKRHAATIARAMEGRT